MTLAELLSGLAAEPDRKAVVKGLQDNVHSIYQEIFDAGHGAATAASTTVLDRLTADVARLTGELGTATKRLTDGSGTEAFKQRETEYQKEIADLKVAVTAAETQAANEVKSERIETALATFETKLVSLGVDPDFAKLQREKQATRDRLDLDDKRKLVVMQAGKTIPYAPSEGKDPLDLMAEEIHAATPKKFLSAPGDRGSNQGNGAAGAGGGGSYLANLKASLETQRAAENKSAIETLDERLARRSSPAL